MNTASPLTYPDLPATHRYNSGFRTSPTPGTTTQRLAEDHQRRCQQESILRKLGALWAARPKDGLLSVLAYAEHSYSPYLDSDDEAMEGALDKALAAEGVTVSGGWRS